MNGESSVHIDRGRWLYRFSLGTDNIAIHRAERFGQDLASPEVWRCLAPLGISDVFVVPVGPDWQPFVEVAEGGQRWALAARTSPGQAEEAARHFLASLADSVAHAAHAQTPVSEKDGEPLRVPEPPPGPAEDPAAATALAEAYAARETAGWELVYSRQRASR